MFKLKCENCGNEYILNVKDKAALICEECGGHLEVIEDMRKDAPEPVHSFHGGWKPPKEWDSLVGTVISLRRYSDFSDDTVTWNSSGTPMGGYYIDGTYGYQPDPQEE